MKMAGSENSELLNRVRALEDREEILRTINQYGHTIGFGDQKGWLDCFTDDALFEVHPRKGTIKGTHPHPEILAGSVGGVIRYSGRDELSRFISKHPSPPARYHKHMAIDPIITLDGDSATVVSFYVRLDAGKDGSPYLTAFGIYRDRMVRAADGRWRIRERIAETQSRGPDPF